MRTGSPLNLSLAEPMWKQLAGMSLNVTDLNEIDKDYVPGLLLFLFVIDKTPLVSGPLISESHIRQS